MPVTIRGHGPNAARELPAILSEGQVANLLDISISQLRRLGYEKRGPKTVRVGSVRVVTRDALMAWLSARSR